jgi:Tol biopolymer transport system component
LARLVVPFVALLLTASPAPSKLPPANGGSGNAAISANGRYVAFASAASNLVRRDTNRVYDVFVRDRVRGTTERVSLGSHGVQANAQTGLSGISANGRFVLMWSEASNLTVGDTNGVADVFVRDRVSKTTERVSIGLDGAQLASESGQAVVSASGRFIAFESAATVYVYDRVRRTTEFIDHGGEPALSANGRYVAFSNGFGQIVVRDRRAGSTELVSVASDGTPLSGTAVTPTISANGRLVAFVVEPPLLPPNPGAPDALYVRDRLHRATELIQNSVGNPSISPDGRTVAYQGGQPGGFQEVIVKDLVSGVSEIASLSSRQAREDGPSFTGVGPLSLDGRIVAFLSDASNLVSGDTNHATDVFLRDRRHGVTELISVAARPRRKGLTAKQVRVG